MEETALPDDEVSTPHVSVQDNALLIVAIPGYLQNHCKLLPIPPCSVQRLLNALCCMEIHPVDQKIQQNVGLRLIRTWPIGFKSVWHFDCIFSSTNKCHLQQESSEKQGHTFPYTYPYTINSVVLQH
jgi:hypothetical protein